jgi:uncharacterized membrane protein YagU involved in acid resistance
VATVRIAEGLGYPLDDQKRELAGCALHYGLGITRGPVYSLLRRQGGMQPLGAGLLTGATLSLIVDEGLAPALGFSVPSTDYPALTHVRGFLNHLAYRAAVALMAVGLYRVTDTSPRPV